jgi:hypothetical protein
MRLAILTIEEVNLGGKKQKKSTRNVVDIELETHVGYLHRSLPLSYCHSIPYRHIQPPKPKKTKRHQEPKTEEKTQDIPKRKHARDVKAKNAAMQDMPFPHERTRIKRATPSNSSLLLQFKILVLKH